METMERDPKYIAETLRQLRKLRGLTQQNLSDLSGLATRTIEKVESGRHQPEEQTVRSLARALGMDVSVFNKPTPEEETRQRRNMERAIRKTALVPTCPVRSAKDFLDCYGEWDAWRIDTSAVEIDGALDIAATMADWIQDMDGIWGLCSMSQQLDYARSFAELCQEIEGHGYLCHMGHHRQRLRAKGKPDLIFNVGLMSLQPKDKAEGLRYALVQLEGGWETLEQDRVRLPDEQRCDISNCE